MNACRAAIRETRRVATKSVFGAVAKLPEQDRRAHRQIPKSDIRINHWHGDNWAVSIEYLQRTGHNSLVQPQGYPGSKQQAYTNLQTQYLQE